jgi:hypothetical protein
VHSRAPERPERRSTETEIRQHIIGDWLANDPRNNWYPRLIIAENGAVTGVETNGTRVLLGTWELYHSALRVTPPPDSVKAARAKGFLVNDWDYFPVVYADYHELVMAPGISVAGRWRYKK